MKRAKMGPALLVTAAFIGPGTVTTATLAGAGYGYALVWALVFSVFATFVLQEMAARLGLATGSGLSEALKQSLGQKHLKYAAMALVVAAIGVGNAAYESGNITGAVVGLEPLTGLGKIPLVLVLTGVSFVLLWSGRFRVLQIVLVGLVALMSVVFVAAMFIAKPDWVALLRSMFAFQLPEGSLTKVVALIGTTVVPYNLFLHAKLVNEGRENTGENGIASLDLELKKHRNDTAISVAVGGFITLAILSTAAAAFFGKEGGIHAGNMAVQLEPLLGSYAKYFFAMGLFAAGLTSAITAPLAAAYAIGGVFGWPCHLSNPRLRCVWGTILLIGCLVSCLEIRPLLAILFAQATNGLLLPVIACFLLWVMNQKALLGPHYNRLWNNVAGAVVVAVVSGLGFYKLVLVFI